jgi:chloride channel 7
VNRSAPHIEEDFALHRTYIIFRTMGLRHLTVVDIANRVVGLISRKDLMGFNLEEKLEQRKRRGFSLEGGIQKLLPSEQADCSRQMWK